MIAWLHPVVVHFAISILLVGVLFDTFGLVRSSEKLIFAGYCNTLIAAFSAVVAVATGLLAETHLGPHSAIGNALLSFHKVFAISVTIVAVGLGGWRIAMRGAVFPRIRSLYLGIAFTASALLFLTGAVGGVLVYWYGLGVPPETARRVLEAQPVTPAPAAASAPSAPH
jgi:uncharacterized membrane protein